MVETHNFAASHLHAITRQIFIGAGAPRHIADSVAGVLVNANLSGHDSHGVLRIPQYLGWIADGSLQPAAEPSVVKETPNSLLVDGNHGFGHYASLQTIHMAIEKAKTGNVACANLVHMSHIGRLGEYAEAAARESCIGVITCGVGLGCTTPTRVVPFGGAIGKLDTNAIAIGVPTGDGAPFIADFATSVVAEGKVRVAQSKNLDLAEGCILDKHGNATVKPADFFDGGWLLPLGRHKGYALSLMTCLLGGLSPDIDLGVDGMSGAFMQVINIQAFTPLDSYGRGVRAFLDGMRHTPPAPGYDEVLVPGDLAHRRRVERLTNGIELPETTYQHIRDAAAQFNAPMSEEIVETADVEQYHRAVS